MEIRRIREYITGYGDEWLFGQIRPEIARYNLKINRLPGDQQEDFIRFEDADESIV